MWRSYYEQRYAALLVDLYALNRDEYGFSPADSLAIGFGNLGQREHDVLSCPDAGRCTCEITIPFTNCGHQSRSAPS